MADKFVVRIDSDEDWDYIFAVKAVSNYSDGVVKGERPAVKWVYARLPQNVLKSGIMNIKDEPKLSTRSEAISRALELLPDEIVVAVDMWLETYADEA
jgi:hypothetical protein